MRIITFSWCFTLLKLEGKTWIYFWHAHSYIRIISALALNVAWVIVAGSKEYSRTSSHRISSCAFILCNSICTYTRSLITILCYTEFTNFAVNITGSKLCEKKTYLYIYTYIYISSLAKNFCNVQWYWNKLKRRTFFSQYWKKIFFERNTTY